MKKSLLEWEYEQYIQNKKTRNERKRDAERFTLTVFVIVFAIVFAGIFFAWASFLDGECNSTTQKKTAAEALKNAEDDGRLPGDDVPATEYCYLIEEPEDFENEKIEAALLDRANVIEGAKVTHYCSERYPHICGTGDGKTASGRWVTPYVSIAVDPDVIPLGSDVLVDYGDGGLHYYRADDKGPGVKGNHIDVAVTYHDEAERLGIKTATIYWCKEDGT